MPLMREPLDITMPAMRCCSGVSPALRSRNVPDWIIAASGLRTSCASVASISSRVRSRSRLKRATDSASA